MNYQSIPLEKLIINRANDRHGELENETAAIAWLFSNHLEHMRKLARDIVKSERVFEPPLVRPDGSNFVVYDGNRRTTCLKLLASPKRAPDAELREFFTNLRKSWIGSFPVNIYCQVEVDHDVIEEILFRRHTGIQGGVGQSNWTDRMKANFINRTGKGGKLNVADVVEERLQAAGLIPKTMQIPRSNFNRLLSSETYRNRVGITTTKGRFEFIRREDVALKALARIAHDMVNKHKTLDDVWDADRKLIYLDELENQGVLPSAADTLIVSASNAPAQSSSMSANTTSARVRNSVKRTTLIPQDNYSVLWSGHIQRPKAIWNELQYKLKLDDHPNAIAVLFRVLLELSVDNYISRSRLYGISGNDSLVKKLIASAENMQSSGKISKKYVEVVRKARNLDEIVSVDTLNKYIHSSNLAPSSVHLTALWETFSELIVLCLNE
ncbi:hypothetical protein LQT97_06810 [Brucella pseudogrignonensis]|uniref:hypothetical protein n=1 Tax=Brucella pseudogrignonensis TaxID=419475 RepID=UPI001E395E5B|nr:hypothetical protein [Brucella pseudogrignonensis]MCD4510947.1 hypothetical protein [Brucella pseudogrignonensis]